MRLAISLCLIAGASSLQLFGMRAAAPSLATALPPLPQNGRWTHTDGATGAAPIVGLSCLPLLSSIL